MSFREYLLKNRKRIVTRCLVISFFACVALAGYAAAVVSEKEKIQKQPPSESPVPVAAEEQRTARDCMVSWEYVYETCGHRLTEEKRIAEDMTGLTLKELENKFRDVRVLDFSPHAISLQKRFQAYCPDHLLLKVHDGVLGVFRTQPGSDAQALVLRIAVRAAELTEEHKEALRFGAVFNSMEEVQAYVREKLGK